MASRSRTRLTLNEVLSGVFGIDFGLSDSESSEDNGDYVCTYSGKHNLASGEVVALSKAVNSELTEDHNDPGEFSAMSAVPSACYDSSSEDDDQEETLECFGESSPCIYKNYCLFISAVFYPCSLWAIAGCFPQAIVNVICLCLQVLLLHLKTLVTVRVMRL